MLLGGWKHQRPRFVIFGLFRTQIPANVFLITTFSNYAENPTRRKRLSNDASKDKIWHSDLDMWGFLFTELEASCTSLRNACFFFQWLQTLTVICFTGFIKLNFIKTEVRKTCLICNELLWHDYAKMIVCNGVWHILNIYVWLATLYKSIFALEKQHFFITVFSVTTLLYRYHQEILLYNHKL